MVLRTVGISQIWKLKTQLWSIMTTIMKKLRTIMDINQHNYEKYLQNYGI